MVVSAQSNEKAQISPATSQSVSLALPSTDAVADSANSMSGMTVFPPSAALSVPTTAASTTLESGARLQALVTYPLAAAGAPV